MTAKAIQCLQYIEALIFHNGGQCEMTNVRMAGRWRHTIADTEVYAGGRCDQKCFAKMTQNPPQQY
jgi:hypothetical protein